MIQLFSNMNMNNIANFGKILLHGTASAAAAVCAVSAFACMDCNPSLYITDKWMTFKASKNTLFNTKQYSHNIQSSSLSSVQNVQQVQQVQQQEEDTTVYQNIWIIGSSSGIGEELAYQLSQEVLTNCYQKHQQQRHRRRQRRIQQQSGSANKYHSTDMNHKIHLILSSRSIEKLKEIANKCQNEYCSVSIVPFDVTGTENEIRTAVKTVSKLINDLDPSIQQQHQRINDSDNNKDVSTHHQQQQFNTGRNVEQETIVIMNAGIGQLSSALESNVQCIENIWKSTALWPMILTPLLFEYNIFQKQQQPLQAALPQIPPLPHIVVTSSIAALLPVPLSSCYCAMKHSLHGYFRSVYAENPTMILQLLCPGPVDTNFQTTTTIQSKSTNTITTATNIESNTTTSSTCSDVVVAPAPTTIPTSSNKLKMSVQRCSRLMLCSILYMNESWWSLLLSSLSLSLSTSTSLSLCQQYWIAKQPVLLGLYLEKFLPSSFLDKYVYGMIGPKRVQIHQQGYDIYDPASWRK